MRARGLGIRGGVGCVGGGVEAGGVGVEGGGSKMWGTGEARCGGRGKEDVGDGGGKEDLGSGAWGGGRCDFTSVVNFSYLTLVSRSGSRGPRRSRIIASGFFLIY